MEKAKFEKIYKQIADLIKEVPQNVDMKTAEAYQCHLKLTEAALWLRLYYEVDFQPQVQDMKVKTKIREEKQ